MKKLLGILVLLLLVSGCKHTLAPENSGHTIILNNEEILMSREEAGDTLRIHNRVFGSPENPLTNGEYGVLVIDMPVEITGCMFYLDGGHGIGVWGDNTDVEYCVIKYNNFVVTDSLNRYVIRVGHDSSDEPYTVYNPLVYGNNLTCVEADTYKHNLFVGHCINPTVQWNRVTGGGYGIGIKGCDNAWVEYNTVLNTSRQAIVEKSGFDCTFTKNIADVKMGMCFRVTDDPTGRQSIGSSWWGNVGVQRHEWRQVFGLDTPFDPIEQYFTAHSNTYRTNSGWTQSVMGSFYTLEEFRTNFEQELNSEVTPTE
jgi:hypothetical protein